MEDIEAREFPLTRTRTVRNALLPSGDGTREAVEEPAQKIDSVLPQENERQSEEKQTKSEVTSTSSDVKESEQQDKETVEQESIENIESSPAVEIQASDLQREEVEKSTAQSKEKEAEVSNDHVEKNNNQAGGTGYTQPSRRAHIINEIIQTEISYIKCLHIQKQVESSTSTFGFHLWFFFLLISQIQVLWGSHERGSSCQKSKRCDFKRYTDDLCKYRKLC